MHDVLRNTVLSVRPLVMGLSEHVLNKKFEPLLLTLFGLRPARA